VTRSAFTALRFRWSSAAASNAAPMLISLAALLMMAGLSQELQAEDWPWFLGPKHTGESSETNLNLDWSKAVPPTVWKQSVGTGYSAPSVLGERLVVHHRMGDEEIISCRSVTDGDEIWKYAYASTFQDPYGYNNGPRCSPILTTEHCIALGAEGMLVCVTMSDGKLIWEKDLRKEFSLPEWFLRCRLFADPRRKPFDCACWRATKFRCGGF
jgi:outer membrane protein assembly factor BamB